MIEIGRRIIAAADDLGLRPEVAAWIYLPELGEWRLHLATSLYDVLGPQWLYRRLIPALPKLVAGLDLSEFGLYLGSPNEALLRGVRRLCRTDPEAFDGLVLHEVQIDDIELSAHIYRSADPMARTKVKRTQKNFERRAAEVLQAA